MSTIIVCAAWAAGVIAGVLAFMSGREIVTAGVFGVLILMLTVLGILVAVVLCSRITGYPPLEPKRVAHSWVRK